MMLEVARTPMFVFVVIAWLLPVALIVALVRTREKVTPKRRRDLRRIAWGHGAAAIIVMLLLSRAMLPGWFYADLLAIFIPLQIVLIAVLRRITVMPVPPSSAAPSTSPSPPP